MIDDCLEYKFVIIGASGYYEFGYHDVMNHPNVVYHSTYLSGIKSMLNRELVKLNFSRKINKWLHYPLSACVNPILFPHQFSTTDKICFLFFESHFMIYYSNYIQYLRKKFPNCKVVLFLQDILGTKKEIDVNKIKVIFDLIVSYDKGNCDEYHFLYHPTPMSYMPVAENPSIPVSDVYFCGKAKSRYPLIHKIYRTLTEKGVKCDFNVIELPADAEKVEGINYMDSGISYLQNIQHVTKSKCILEIMQEGASGYTPRLWESIVYDRILITNNQSLETSEFYKNNNMLIISDEDINSEKLLHMLKDKVIYSDDDKNRLSPINLLQFIQTNIR